MLRSIGLLLALATLFAVSSAIRHHSHSHYGRANDNPPDSDEIYEMKLNPPGGNRPIHRLDPDDYYSGEEAGTLRVRPRRGLSAMKK